MNVLEELNQKLEGRRKDLLLFILCCLFVPSFLSFLAYLVLIIINPEVLEMIHWFIFFIIALYNISIVSIFKKIHQYNSDYVYKLLLILFGFPIFFIIFNTGTVTNIIYILFSILILIICYIYPSRSYRLLFYIFAIFLLLISILQINKIIPYNPILSQSSIVNTIVSIALLYVIVRIAGIGFEQIEHSYNQAYKYAKELENINENLNELIQKRTEQLENEYVLKADTLEQLIVAGRVVRPVFHDISSPLTVIKGNLSFLKEDIANNKPVKEFEKYLNTIGDAELQIERVMTTGRELISRSATIESFNISEVLEQVVSILKTEFNRKKILLTINAKSDLHVKGIRNIFERVIINILINSEKALDDLNNSTKCIDIMIKKKEKFAVVIIKDNGSGMCIEKLDEIQFSNSEPQSKDGHFGIGISFVKDAIEKTYKGKFFIESKVNEGTQIKLYIPCVNASSSKRIVE